MKPTVMQGWTLRKRWLPLFAAVWLSCTAAVMAGGLPKPTQAFFVNDYADILSPQAEAAIIAEGKALEAATTAQAVVVTVPNLDGRALEEYSLELARAWGVGQKDKDNGVLLFISRDDKKIRMEVGYGLEGALPDGKTGRILDEYLIPSYKAGDFDTGTTDAYRAMLASVYQEYGKEPPEGISGYQVSEEAPVAEGKQIPSWLKIIGFLILLWIVRKNPWLLWLLLRNGGRGGGGGGGGSSGGGGGFGGGGSSRGW